MYQDSPRTVKFTAYVHINDRFLDSYYYPVSFFLNSLIIADH